jgi:hypothetical protein
VLSLNEESTHDNCQKQENKNKKMVKASDRIRPKSARWNCTYYPFLSGPGDECSTHVVRRLATHASFTAYHFASLPAEMRLKL